MIFISTAQYIADGLSGTETRETSTDDTETVLARDGQARHHRHALLNLLMLRGPRAWLIRRRRSHQLQQAIIRLAEVSPHLLDDIGAEAPAQLDIPAPAPQPRRSAPPRVAVMIAAE